MYSHAYSKLEGALVSLWSGAQNSTEDFEVHLAAWRRLDEDGGGRTEGLIHFVEVDEGNPRPDAHWRAKIAESNRALKSPRIHFALITTSPLVRGVMTAIRWITPTSPLESYSFPTFEEAARWAGQRRGRHLPILEQLRREARANAVTGTHTSGEMPAVSEARSERRLRSTDVPTGDRKAVNR